MLIRSSTLATFKLCPQRAFFQYDLGLASKDACPSVDLEFGKVVHKSIEIFHKQSKEVAFNYIEESDFPQTSVKSKLRARTLLEIYIQKQPLNLIANEKEFTFKIGKHVWKGRFDGVADYLDGLYIVEYKTTNPYFLRTKPSDQFISYWGGGRIFYHDIKGVILTSLDPTSLAVERYVISYTRDEFERWRAETKLTLAFYQRCLTARVFPKTPSACMAYRRQCPYMILCTAPPEIHEHIISNFFVVSEEQKNKSW